LIEFRSEQFHNIWGEGDSVENASTTNQT
jgi:hypothetical protein